MTPQTTSITSIEGNRQKLDGGAMFGNAPKALWEKWFSPDQSNRITLACRGLLIEHGSTKILCETGIGAFFEPKLAERYGVEGRDHRILASLKQLGIDHGEIDYVILSHLHFDHAGGLLPSYDEAQKGEDQLLFPNAQYVVGKEAYERALTPHFRDKASFIPGMTEKLNRTGRLRIVTGRILDGVLENRLSFRFTSGHTPGHMHTVFRGDKQTVIFAGDLIPGAAWIHLPITMGYDRYPELVIEEKSEFYKEVVSGQWLVFYTHDPKIPASKITRSEDGKYSAFEEVSDLVRYSI